MAKTDTREAQYAAEATTLSRADLEQVYVATRVQNDALALTLGLSRGSLGAKEGEELGDAIARVKRERDTARLALEARIK